MSFDTHRLATDCCSVDGGDEFPSPQGGASDGAQNPSTAQETPEWLLRITRDFCSGRTEAVEELIAQFRRWIQPECARRSTNLECETADLEQEVLAKAFELFARGKAWSTFSTEAEAKAWLIKATRTSAIDQSRKQGRMPKIKRDADPDAPNASRRQRFRSTEPLPLRADEADCDPQMDLLAAECKAAMARLPERNRLCLSMYCHGYTYQEIAHELHSRGLTGKRVRPGSVHAYLKAGRSAIRRKLSPPPNRRSAKRRRNR